VAIDDLGSVAAETLKLGAVSNAPKPLDLRYFDHLGPSANGESFDL
jgi:hypothetical protein